MNPLKSIYNTVKDPLWNIALRTYVGAHRTYQPLGDEKTAAGGRPDSAFRKRWEAVADQIEKCEAKNLLDIGCAEGWFVRNARMKSNIFALGLDQNRRSLRLASAFSELQGDQGYGFVAGTFSPKELQNLPKFDVVICFSLVHHVVKVEGREGGIDYLKACRAITGKRFLFDMGGPDEVSHSWASKMDFLAGDIDKNMADFLRDAGFTDVEKISESMAHVDNVPRPLFACSPGKGA